MPSNPLIFLIIPPNPIVLDHIPVFAIYMSSHIMTASSASRQLGMGYVMALGLQVGGAGRASILVLPSWRGAGVIIALGEVND